MIKKAQSGKGSFSPPAHTTPGVRVRTGRFPKTSALLAAVKSRPKMPVMRAVMPKNKVLANTKYCTL